MSQSFQCFAKLGTIHRTIRRSHLRVFSAAVRPFASYRVSEQDVAKFKEDGFFIVRGMLDASEVDLVKQAIEQDDSLNQSQNQIELNDESGGTTKLSLWSNPGDGTLGMHTRSERVAGTMAKLLGGPVMHYHSKNLIKKPREGGVWNWHQDYGYWYKDFFLLPHLATAYLAVDPCTKANGCLKLLRGSHELGRLDHWSKGDQQGADLERVELAKQRYEEVFCEMAPGDLCFFSALTLHSSQGNFSDNRRLAFASCFTRADNVQFRDAYIPCFPVDVVEDSALLSCGLKVTSSSDKVMMAGGDVGKAAARKDETFQERTIKEIS